MANERYARFIASGDSRETSREIMAAIASLARNEADAVRMWEDPTPDELRAIRNVVTDDGKRSSTEFVWGASGPRWAPANEKQATTQIALFDTGAGFLQWLGTAECHEDAIRAHLADIGFNQDVPHSFRAIDVTDAQAAALSAWWEGGARSPDYPADLPAGQLYDAAKVAALMAINEWDED